MAVMVALLMVPLLGFAAISIDVAAMWSERQDLQTGADAAALAVAQDCARGNCGSAASTAQNLATANVDGGVSTSVGSPGADQVSVTTSGVRHHLFAPVLGITSSTIVAHSTAAWGFPTGGTAKLPLAVSWCDFQAHTGGDAPTDQVSQTILLSTAPATAKVPADSASPSVPVDSASPSVPADSATQTVPAVAAAPQAPDTSCTGPAGAVPSGFGWLDTDGGACQASSSIDAGASSWGDSVPGACSSKDFEPLLNSPVLLPIFDASSASSGGGRFGIYGYAAFTVTGYHFAGQLDSGSPCSGSDSCLSGYFTRSVDLSDRFGYRDDAPQLGAAVVSLTQ